MAGIQGYGVQIPIYRIKVEEIARVWGKNAEKVKAGLLISEKSLTRPNEDSATLAVDASRIAVRMAGFEPQKIGAVYVGSESKPYAVKPTATIVAEAIMATPVLTAADLEFACKAGTAGVQLCMALVDAGRIEFGLAVGTDTAQGQPGDALEFTAGSGAAAFVIGPNKGSLATIDDTFSFTTDTPDFWRRQHAEFPRHGGRFTGEPAYFRHVISATKGLLEKTGKTVDDFDYVVFHQPNGKFPLVAAKRLGIPKEKILAGLLTPKIGNTYSAASLIGLAAVLDVAKAEQKILVTSFGSGAGSDSFSITVTKEIEKKRPLGLPVEKLVNRHIYVDYGHYVKNRKKLKNI